MSSFALSSPQRRIWFAEQLRDAGSAYVIPAALRLRGELDISALRQAMTAMMHRHPMLRARILVDQDGRPYQSTDPRGGAAVASLIDQLGAVDTPGGERAAQGWATERVGVPMDLAEGPLFHPALRRIRHDDHLLVMPVHHIVCDGYGLGVLQRDLLACYEAIHTGAELPPAPSMSIAALATADVDPSEAAGHADVHHFASRLQGAPQLLDLPTDRPRPARSSFRGFTVTAALPATLTAAVRGLAATERATPFVVYCAALHVLLARYAACQDTVFGFTSANRLRPDSRDVVGLLANTLPLRVCSDGDRQVRALIRELRAEVLAAAAHGQLRLEDLVETLRLPRSLGHHPVFQVLINYFELPPVGEGCAGLRVDPLLLDSGSAWLDLELNVRRRHDDSTDLVLRCSAELFDESTGSRMVGHLAELLRQMVADPSCRVSGLSLMGTGEREIVRAAGTGPSIASAAEGTLHGLLMGQLQRHPDQPAVSCGDRTLSYRELRDRAVAVAKRLQGYGVGPDVAVGLCAQRSLELVVGVVGIALAGGAYLPLDPDHPQRRRALMLKEAQAAVLLSGPGIPPDTGGSPIPVLPLQDLLAEPADSVALPGSAAPGADSLAYILYTSGSTGRPKGVANTQRGIHNRLCWMQDFYRLQPGDAVLHKTPVSFDVSVWELLWPLVTGARMVLAQPGGHRDPDYLRALIADEGISVVHFVPSMLRAFLDAGGFPERSRLRHIVCSGEALSAELRDAVLRSSAAELHNLYGPTEAAIDVTAATCQPSAAGGSPVTIGRAVPNTRVHVLDEYRRLAPFGVVGELYLGGVQLARGYLGNPDLTDQRFVSDPLGDGAERLYRTGDLGRMRPDGMIEFIGRADRQVKLRGFRIEPGEIEAATERIPGVSQAVVSMVTDDIGHGRLVAYVVAGSPTLRAEHLHAALAGVLPDYMLPSNYHFLTELPLTSSGKVDHHRLPVVDPVELARVSSAPTPARTDAERCVLDAMQQVIGRADIGAADSFFALGGDSIRSIELVAQARRRGLVLSVEDVFTCPTARELARIAQSSAPDGSEDPQPAPPASSSPHRAEEMQQETYPLSALLRGLVVESSRANEYRCYVTSLQLRGHFEEQQLRAAVRDVLARHPYLRSSLRFDGSPEPAQLVHAEVPDPLAVVDLRSPVGQRPEPMASLVERESRTRFDWTVPPLLRITVHLLTGNEFRVTISEPFLDGWSATLLVTELLENYELRLDGVRPPTPRVVHGYTEFLLQERRVLGSAQARDFWREQVVDAPVTAVPRGDDGDPHPRANVIELDAEVSEALRSVASATGSPVKSVLLAAHVRVLATLTGQAEVVTGLMANARPETDDGARAVGLFLNTNVLRVRLPGGSWRELIAAVRQAEATLLPHRAYPYSQVLRDNGIAGLAEATFNYTHFHPYRRIGGRGRLHVTGRYANDQTYFPLTAQFHQDAINGRIRLRLEFTGSGFDDWHRSRIAGLYEAVLADLARAPEGAYHAPVDAGDGGGGGLRGAPPAVEPRWLPQLFDEQASRRPEATAILTAQRDWSYFELRAAARSLAADLERRGVGPGDRVGVCLRRGPALVAALLAATAIGAIYTPLDPAVPAHRRAQFVRRAGCRIVLVEDHVEHWEPGVETTVVTLASNPTANGVEPPRWQPRDPEEPAILMFTSGSAQQPKGVLLSHRAVHNRLAWGWRALPFTAGETISARTPIGFVDSINELLSGLLAGTPTFLLDDDTRDPKTLATTLAAHRVSRVTLVPTVLSELLRADDLAQLANLRYWTLSGEPLSTELARELIRRLPDAVVHNLYGTTEVTADVTAYRVRGDESGPLVPIGIPIDGCVVTVVDAWGNPAPSGCIGELVVSGRPVATRYWDAAAVDAQRFVALPPSGERAYRTGDLARCDAGGRLHYVSRADRQLKVRGVRLEPAEIESALRRLPGVRDAVVAQQPSEGGELVAYLLPAGGDATALSRPQLRSALGATLPTAAIPQRFTWLPEWPRTTTGKIDHRALARMATPLDTPRVCGQAPDTLAERELAALWAHRLGVRKVCREDDFFDLGGNSLQAILLVRELHERFDIVVSIAEIFNNPLLADQAELVERLLLAEAGMVSAHG